MYIPTPNKSFAIDEEEVRNRLGYISLHSYYTNSGVGWLLVFPKGCEVTEEGEREGAKKKKAILLHHLPPKVFA